MTADELRAISRKLSTYLELHPDGTVQRVMIDKISGKIAYAVVSFGGFLGMGEEYPMYSGSSWNQGLCISLLAFQSPNQWLRVLMNQNPSMANHTSAKIPARRISRRVSGAPEAMRSTLSSRLQERGPLARRR
jgi:hypothetical protein